MNDAGPERSDDPLRGSDDAPHSDDFSSAGAEGAQSHASPPGLDDQGAPSPSGTDSTHGDSSPSGIPVSAAEAMAIVDPSMVRRAPRYGRVGVISALVGLVFCAVATFAFASPTEFMSLPGVFLLTSVFVVPVFVFAGLAIALLVDGAGRRRRARRLEGRS